jgi:hypothetical protein
MIGVVNHDHPQGRMIVALDLASGLANGLALGRVCGAMMGYEHFDCRDAVCDFA